MKKINGTVSNDEEARTDANCKKWQRSYVAACNAVGYNEALLEKLGATDEVNHVNRLIACCETQCAMKRRLRELIADMVDHKVASELAAIKEATEITYDEDHKWWLTCYMPSEGAMTVNNTDDLAKDWFHAEDFDSNFFVISEDNDIETIKAELLDIWLDEQMESLYAEYDPTWKA